MFMCFLGPLNGGYRGSLDEESSLSCFRVDTFYQNQGTRTLRYLYSIYYRPKGRDWELLEAPSV